jgi:signal transduction histidine kinase
MFRLLRFFLATSVIAAIVIAIAFFLYHRNEVERLIELAERQNVELAQSFANTIWPRFSSYVMSAPASEKDGEVVLQRRRAIAEAVRAVSADLPVLKVKIYNLEGLTVYSSEPAEIGEYKTNNPGFFTAAREGRVASKLTFRDSFSSFEGTVQERDLVESYLPIRQSNGPVEGVFELYSDVTPLMVIIARSTTRFIIGFLLIFGALYSMIFVVVRRADRMIKQQYVEILNKNTELESEVRERKKAEETVEKARDELEQRVAERSRELVEEIAERKRAEDETRRHEDELTHIGRVSIIGEMATSLAHDLNQPLTVISGCAQFCIDKLRASKGNAEQLLDALEQTAEQAHRANEIVRRVRGFVHKEASERRVIDLNNVIRDIADLLHSDAREHETEIRLDLAESVPSVVADPIQIQQVILNLAHNGIEAMNDGDPASRSVCIHTSTRRDGTAEVAVSDRGQGVSTDDLNRIFDPFFTTKPQGLGMGLSISRTIIEAHGGRLWATSNRENGSIFRFTLPMAKDGISNGI